MDLYLLNELNKLEAGGGATAASSNMFLPLAEDGSLDDSVIPIVSRSGQRQNAYPNSWSSSYGGTTFYTYNGDTHSQKTRFWMASGMNRKDTIDLAGAEGTAPEIFYAHDHRVNICKGHTSTWNGQSYAPWRTSIMFIKNKGTSSKSVTLYTGCSSNWSSGHDGVSLTTYTPNSADPSAVTSVSYSTPWSYTNSTSHTTNSSDVTIDAGKTVAVVLANSMYYHQDTNSNASWHDLHHFYYLNTTFSDPDIVPDLEMTQTYLMSRHIETSYTDQPYRLWNAKAAFFPDA